MNKTTVKILPPQELERLLAVIPERSPFGSRDKAMVILALHTGLRVSELCGLDHHHVAWEGRIRSWLELPRELAKGSKGRAIPLNAMAREAIGQIIRFNQERGFSVAPEAPLLVTRYHTRLPIRSFQGIIQKYREMAGLDVKPTPHTFRHQFASHVASATGNLRLVQELGGWARLNTVEVYTHPTPRELEEAVRRIA